MSDSRDPGFWAFVFLLVIVVFGIALICAFSMEEDSIVTIKNAKEARIKSAAGCENSSKLAIEILTKNALNEIDVRAKEGRFDHQFVVGKYYNVALGIRAELLKLGFQVDIEYTDLYLLNINW